MFHRFPRSSPSACSKIELNEPSNLGLCRRKVRTEPPVKPDVGQHRMIRLKTIGDGPGQSFLGDARSQCTDIPRRLLTALFIDSVLLHRLWRCHRIPSRSFFLRGRQFHICARCTGIIIGLIASPVALYCLGATTIPFVLFFLANGLDGGTQLVGLRASNNWLRLGLGSGFGLTLLSAFVAIASRSTNA